MDLRREWAGCIVCCASYGSVGEFVYSVNAEKESSTRRTLHAGVNTRKDANGERFLLDGASQPTAKVNAPDKKVIAKIRARAR